MEHKLERILQKVLKPARYVGGEYNQTVKAKDEVDIRVAFCFPDMYEIGMSNLGMRIIYGILNGIDGVWCERVFTPWVDMEQHMRESGVPLYGLESGDPIGDFDIIAFSIGYELSYTNVLNMLDLAGVPLHSKNRDENAPLVIAGGTCSFNPEPLSDFIDLFVVGDGEDVVCEIIALYRASKAAGECRADFLKSAARICGVYVPAFYAIEYNEDNTVSAITANGAELPVKKRIVQDFETSFFPIETIVPSTEIVHDRVVLELFRGCSRGCKFCQAGHI